MSSGDLREDVQAIAAGPPSDVAWSSVCELLGTVAADRVSEVVTWVDAAFSAWPPRLRRAPASWVEDVRAGRAQPRLRACAFLDLARAAMPAADLIAVLRAGETHGMTVVDLAGNGLDAAMAAEVAVALSNSSVAELCVSDNPLARGFTAFIDAEAPPNLAALDAVGCAISDDVLSAAAAKGLHRPLRRLVLGFNSFHGAGAASLVTAPGFEHVEHLDLRAANLLGDGVEAVARSERIGNVRWLNLSLTQCGDRGAIAVGESPYLGKLEHLSLVASDVGDAGALSLGGGHLERLRVLELNDNVIGADGARGIVDSEALSSLRDLRLDGNPLGDEGVIAIAESPRAARLSRLVLKDEDLTEDGHRALRESPYLRRTNVIVI